MRARGQRLRRGATRPEHRQSRPAARPLRRALSASSISEGAEAPRPRFLGQPTAARARRHRGGGGGGRQARGPACEREGNVRKRCSDGLSTGRAGPPWSLSDAPGDASAGAACGSGSVKGGGGAGRCHRPPAPDNDSLEQGSTAPGESRGRLHSPRSSSVRECRRPPPAAGLCPPRGEPLARRGGNSTRRRTSPVPSPGIGGRGTPLKSRHPRSLTLGCQPKGDHSPFSSRFAGSSLGPEKKQGRGAATSPVPCRSFHPALPQEGKPGQARHHGPPVYGSCQPKEDEAPLPQPAPSSGPRGSRGKAGLETRPRPRRLHSTAGHRDRPPVSARFAGSSLRPEKNKGRGTTTSPVPVQSLHRALRHHGS